MGKLIVKGGCVGLTGLHMEVVPDFPALLRQGHPKMEPFVRAGKEEPQVLDFATQNLGRILHCVCAQSYTLYAKKRKSATKTLTILSK